MLKKIMLSLLAVCLLALAVIPVWTIQQTDVSIHAEVQAFSKAVKEDFQQHFANFVIDTSFYADYEDDSHQHTLHMSVAIHGSQSQTQYKNVILVDHVRRFCTEYLESRPHTVLYRAAQKNGAALHLSSQLHDDQYASWEDTMSVSFASVYRSHLRADKKDDTGRLLDKLDNPDGAFTMSDLLYFSDCSQIYIRDIREDKENGMELEKWEQFSHLKYLYLHDLRDTETIQAIKQYLPKGCKLMVYDTPTSLKEAV